MRGAATLTHDAMTLAFALRFHGPNCHASSRIDPTLKLFGCRQAANAKITLSPSGKIYLG
jgi:hypothetical protein